jgi:hypothetical protein
MLFKILNIVIRYLLYNIMYIIKYKNINFDHKIINLYFNKIEEDRIL